MRATLLVIIGASLLSAGCSLMIANCGKDLSKVTTREQAREELGGLMESGVKDGEEYDVFHYHGKVPMSWGPRTGMGMGWAMTYGMAEFVWLPRELFKAGREVVLGQEIQVRYDQNGKVTGIRVEGEPWFATLGVDDPEASLPGAAPPPAALNRPTQ